jgi:hypothetical protein
MTGDLAAQQRALVAALVSGAPTPAGFDGRLVGIARLALLRKRAGEVARHWPMLAAGLGERWLPEFRRWAEGRPPQGGLRDGWDLARALRASGELTGPAGEELAAREACWRYDGASAPARRRLPAVRTACGSVVIQLAGRVRMLRPSRPASS